MDNAQVLAGTPVLSFIVNKLSDATPQATVTQTVQFANVQQAGSNLAFDICTGESFAIRFATSGRARCGWSIPISNACISPRYASDPRVTMFQGMLPACSQEVDATPAVVMKDRQLTGAGVQRLPACWRGYNATTGSSSTTPATATVDVPMHAKVWTPRGGERCELPTNELSKAWEPPEVQQTTRSVVFPKSNFTFIAAATEREGALDDRDHGGLATMSLIQCAGEGVPSASGLVTAQDLAACAQQHVSKNVQSINAENLLNEKTVTE